VSDVTSAGLRDGRVFKVSSAHAPRRPHVPYCLRNLQRREFFRVVLQNVGLDYVFQKVGGR
jgi:hypothetical protein